MVTPGLGPGYAHAVRKKGKQRSQIGKISASEATKFFFPAHADFLLLFPLARPQSSLSCLYSLIIY